MACSPRIEFDELMRLRADAVAAAGVALDLVDLAEAGVVLAWEVAQTGRCLYARDPDDEVRFGTRARSRYWDFERGLQIAAETIFESATTS